MKKLFVLVLAAMMLLSLCACGGSGDAGTNEPGAAYDAGNVKVWVPGGWTAYAVKDIFSEDNSNDPNKVNICKGATSEFDLFSKPYIQVVRYDANTTVVSPKDLYDDAADITPITAGELTWTGFTATTLDLPIAILFANDAQGNQFQLNVYLENTGGKITLQDADVLEILGSISCAG